MKWQYRPNPDSFTYSERYAYLGDPKNLVGTVGLRVLKLRKSGTWSIRWGFPIERHLMPPETPLEEVQAVAIALWRMQ